MPPVLWGVRERSERSETSIAVPLTLSSGLMLDIAPGTRTVMPSGWVISARLSYKTFLKGEKKHGIG